MYIIQKQFKINTNNLRSDISKRECHLIINKNYLTDIKSRTHIHLDTCNDVKIIAYLCYYESVYSKKRRSLASL